jgi:transcriptional regulator with XRE-family HTH domain
VEGIGVLLKHTREKKGIALSKAAKDLRIRLQYLVEVESDVDNSSICNVYKLGYLRMYSNYLGIDIEDYFKEVANSANNNEFHPLNEVLSEESKPPLLIIGISITCIIISVIALLIFNKKPEPKHFPSSHGEQSIDYSSNVITLSISGDQYYLDNTGINKTLVAVVANAEVIIKIKDSQGNIIENHNLKSQESLVLPNNEHLVLEVDLPNAIEFYAFSPITMDKKKLIALPK